MYRVHYKMSVDEVDQIKSELTSVAKVTEVMSGERSDSNSETKCEAGTSESGMKCSDSHSKSKNNNDWNNNESAPEISELDVSSSIGL